MGFELRSVAEYENLVRMLVASHPYDEAMSLAVGGDFDAIGKVERQILEHFGLRPGMSLVDVGCGSGRLAQTLAGSGIQYLGTDVVQALLDFAKTKCPQNFAFRLHKALSVPVATHSVDMICAFSVFTHLPHDESYLYMADMFRALKAGGRLVFSFLEFRMKSHWPIFVQTAEAKRSGHQLQLNQFIEREAIVVWAEALSYQAPVFIPGDQAPWGGAALGQSVAVLPKP